MAKREIGNGKEDHFGKWLARLIDSAHVRTQTATWESARESAERTEKIIQQEARANRLLMKAIHQDNHNLLEKFHEQSELFQTQSDRHHRENLEQTRKFQGILERRTRPGEN